MMLIILLPSCMTTRTSVGTYREQEGKVYTYSPKILHHPQMMQDFFVTFLRYTLL